MIIVVPQETRGAVGALVTTGAFATVVLAVAPAVEEAAPPLDARFGSSPLPTPLV